MARRSAISELEYPHFEQEEMEPVKERRSGKTKGPEPPSGRRRLLWWSVPFFALAAALAAVIAFHQVEAFLINDARFRLAPGTRALNINGIKRAQKAEAVKVFEKDFGRSVYLMPIAERRRRVIGLEWVKEAVVSRRWPNRVVVDVTEREPAAFAQIKQAGGGMDLVLIDGDGVLLPPNQGESYDFVVLSGMSAGQSEPERSERVRQALALLKEIGPISVYLSEVDVEDSGDLMAMLKVDGAAAGVRLGNRNFRSRLQNFLQHFPEIRRHTPHARLFDLRMDGRITAIEGDPSGKE
jgi:cell division protein FtsQ